MKQTGVSGGSTQQAKQQGEFLKKNSGPSKKAAAETAQQEAKAGPKSAKFVKPGAAQ